MTPLDSYLSSLKALLPSAGRDDILQELADDLRTQMEEREEALGRPLTALEQQAVVEQLGSPLAVAARYRRDHRTVSFGRQLIGPALFPLYARVLVINLTAAGAIIVGITVVLGRPVGAAATPLFFNLLVQFAILTAIFSLVQRYFEHAPSGSAGPAASDAYVPRLESAAELVALAVFIPWLDAVRRSPYSVFGEGEVLFHLAPVWHAIYWPILVVLLVNAVQAGINLYRPDWTHVRSAARVLAYLTGLILTAVLLQAGRWVLPAASGALDADSQRVLEVINSAVFYNLLGATLVLSVLLSFELRGITRRRMHRSPAPSSQPTI